MGDKICESIDMRVYILVLLVAVIVGCVLCMRTCPGTTCEETSDCGNGEYCEFGYPPECSPLGYCCTPYCYEVNRPEPPARSCADLDDCVRGEYCADGYCKWFQSGKTCDKTSTVEVGYTASKEIRLNA